MEFAWWMVWLGAEAVFFLLMMACGAICFRANETRPRRNVDMGRVFDQVAAFGEVYSLRRFFSGFFHGAPFERIRRGNAARFLSWAMYNSYDLAEEEQREVQATMELLHAKHGIVFPEGLEDGLPHVAMCLQPVSFWPQPLCLYVAHWVIQELGCVFLRCWGYKHHSVCRFGYWTREGLRADLTPVVFFHGISTGWLAYMRFVRQLSAAEADVFLFELNWARVAALDFRRPSPAEVAGAVSTMLELHGFSRCRVAAHSFGTVACTWLLHHRPQLVEKAVLIDPVALLLFLPDVATKFLYARPRTFFQWIVRVFAAREATVAHTLFRNFDWKENALFLEDLDSKHTDFYISYSLADELLPVDALQVHLQHRENVTVWDSFSHAQSLVSSRSLPTLLREITR